MYSTKQMKQSLINYWIKLKTITDKRVINAFKKIPRENFLPKTLKEYAYEDKPLPILKKQTISQPTTIMIMTQALEVKPGNKILEIGSGSGYQSALLSILVGKKGKILTLEIIPELVNFAKNNLKKFENVEVIQGDGSKGYKKQAPYDRIIITAACPPIPKPLIGQLKINGILVAPIGNIYSQKMLKIIKKKNKIITKDLGDFIFVPLKGKYGFNSLTH